VAAPTADAVVTERPEVPVTPRGQALAERASGATRLSVAALLGRQRGALEALFAQWREAAARQRTALQRQLLLGLELRSKLEEQVLLPALQEAEPGWAPALSGARQELELLRDLALLAGSTVAANRQLTLSVIQGLAALHFDRLDELLQADGAHSVAWDALHDEMADMLSRWHAELRARGQIEDEDRDPVGAPPR
jgi:hypothetical protein